MAEIKEKTKPEGVEKDATQQRSVRATRIVLSDAWLETHGVAQIDFYIYEGTSLEDAYVDAKRQLLSLIMRMKGG